MLEFETSMLFVSVTNLSRASLATLKESCSSKINTPHRSKHSSSAVWWILANRDHRQQWAGYDRIEFAWTEPTSFTSMALTGLEPPSPAAGGNERVYFNGYSNNLQFANDYPVMGGHGTLRSLIDFRVYRAYR